MTSAVQVVTPCISVCILDEDSGLCRGCYRTAVEIGAWRAPGAEQQIDILRKIAERWRADRAADEVDEDRREERTRLEARLRLAGLVT